MEDKITQAELKEALLEALFDYEDYKKMRRIKTVKKTLQNTMLATLIGSSGLMAASHNRNNSSEKIPVTTAAESQPVSAVEKLALAAKQPKYIPGVAYFSFNRHTLSNDQQKRLLSLIKQLPENAEISVIGCTDSIGNSAYNEKLGLERARSVAGFLSLHGRKTVSTESKISIDMPEKWMARRVDIIVNTFSEPFYLSSIASETESVTQPFSQNDHLSKAAAKEPVKAVEKSYGLQSNGLQQSQDITDKPAAYSDRDFPVIDDVEGMLEPAMLRQKVRGIAHFPLNGHTLALAHHDRLLGLIKQLSKDARITVVGRTESNTTETNEVGLLRAKSVAHFLAKQGVTIKAVGTKESVTGFTGWGSRSVDLIVDSGPVGKLIDLPEPVKNEGIYRNKQGAVPKGYIGRVPSPYLYQQN